MEVKFSGPEQEWRLDRYSGSQWRGMHTKERYQFAVVNGIYPFGEREVSILDVGCGYGHGFRWLGEMLCEPARQVVLQGVEIEPGIADDLALEAEARVYYGDFLDLRLPLYDVVLCFELLGFERLPSEALVKKLLEVCAPGGRIFLSVPIYRPPHQPKAYYAETFTKDRFYKLLRGLLPGRKIGGFGFTHSITLYGQLHPANRKWPRDSEISPLDGWHREPDFIIARIEKPL